MKIPPLFQLNRVPAAWFELVGSMAAGLAWIAIATQIWTELSHGGSSQLAMINLGGFLLNFSFWTLYGLRFGRPAVWIGNLVGVLLQVTLLVIVLFKNTHS